MAFSLSAEGFLKPLMKFRSSVAFIPIERANSATLISLCVRKNRCIAEGCASSYTKLSKQTSSSRFRQ